MQLEALAKKKEREALLAAEEKEFGAKKPVLKGNDKKAAQKSAKIDQFQKEAQVGVEEFSASGIENALELLDLTTRDSTTSANRDADKLDRHPERRLKSAYAAFEEREMPKLKEENPGLRLSQLKQMLQKMWKKSPENPMVLAIHFFFCTEVVLILSHYDQSTQNQSHIEYNTKAQEAREIVESRKETALNQFKQ